ncbi:MAG: hypothetical protein P4L87_10875 [Formivibrio sp.]|nr:hypothetical protein [Formivibrio sp.]
MKKIITLLAIALIGAAASSLSLAHSTRETVRPDSADASQLHAIDESCDFNDMYRMHRQQAEQPPHATHELNHGSATPPAYGMPGMSL